MWYLSGLTLTPASFWEVLKYLTIVSEQIVDVLEGSTSECFDRVF